MKFQVDTLNSLPEKERICGNCRKFVEGLEKETHPIFRLKGRGYPELVSPDQIPQQKQRQTYYCGKCNRFHRIYSDIGNDHRDYKDQSPFVEL